MPRHGLAVLKRETGEVLEQRRATPGALVAVHDADGWWAALGEGGLSGPSGGACLPGAARSVLDVVALDGARWVLTDQGWLRGL